MPAPVDLDAVPRVQGVVAAFRLVCEVNNSNFSVRPTSLALGHSVPFNQTEVSNARLGLE